MVPAPDLLSCRALLGCWHVSGNGNRFVLMTSFLIWHTLSQHFPYQATYVSSIISILSCKIHNLTKIGIGCIMTSISFITWVMMQDNTDPITNQICDAMVNIILSFGIPNINQLPQPCPDDCKRLRDHLILTNEPQLQTLLAQSPNNMVLDECVGLVYGLLPILLPICFRDWNSEKNVV